VAERLLPRRRWARPNRLDDAERDRRADRASDYNRSDGFSPGQIIVTLVPGLDLRRSGAAPVTNMARSLRRRQLIVVIDAKTLERQLICGLTLGRCGPAGCGVTGAPACLGTPPPPITNVPPELGVDPHDRTGFALPALQQFPHFPRSQWKVHR